MQFHTPALNGFDIQYRKFRKKLTKKYSNGCVPLYNGSNANKLPNTVRFSTLKEVEVFKNSFNNPLYELKTFVLDGSYIAFMVKLG